MGKKFKSFLSMHFDSDEIESKSGEKKRPMKNKLINTSEDVISCAVHPFHGTIVAGTKVLLTTS